MSHFTVLVIGHDPEKQLAPFHEFECTGEDNEFVQDIDITEEARKTYESQTTRQLESPDGIRHDYYADQFYRDPTAEEKSKIGILGGTGCADGISFTSQDWGDGKGYRTKVRYIPEGFKEVEVPQSTTQSFVEFIKDWYGKEPVPYGEFADIEEEHKYGYVLLNKDGSVHTVINRTNPNAKWDWYVLGGRWRGFWKVKTGREGILGKSGVFNNAADLEYDSVLKGAIDFEGMKRIKIAEAKQSWEEYQAKLISGEKCEPYWEFGVENGDTEDTYIAHRSTISTFAVIKDGQWYERGSMGGWACVSDEKENGQWEKEWWDLVNSVSDDMPLSVYDCHI